MSKAGRTKGTGELERIKAQVAALEQLLDVHESTSLEQSTRLEQSLREKEELLGRERTAREALEAAQLALQEIEGQHRKTLERYQLVSRATNDVIWDWDILTSELLWNDAIYTAFHFAPGTVAHTIDFWYEHIHPDDQERVVAGIHKVIDHGGDAWSDEYQFRLGNGEYATVFDRGHVARDAEGKANRMLGAMIDLTNRKRAEEALRHAGLALQQEIEQSNALTEELEAANEQLQEANADAERARVLAEESRAEAEEANKAKATFLANMSHELRTPLNAIGGYAELLSEGIRGPVTDAQRADLVRIKRAQYHLLALINEILNFAKIEAGQVRFDLRDVVVNDVICQLEMLVAPQLQQKQLRYEQRFCDPTLTAHVDPERLQQILLNLLSNAVKFTLPGGQVRVECDASPETLCVRVCDTGVGIPKDKLENVFEPFVQLDRGQTNNSGGTGLGLAISRDLARAMNGDLTVDSTPDAGSTFSLTLPRRAT